MHLFQLVDFFNFVRFGFVGLFLLQTELYRSFNKLPVEIRFIPFYFNCLNKPDWLPKSNEKRFNPVSNKNILNRFAIYFYHWKYNWCSKKWKEGSYQYTLSASYETFILSAFKICKLTFHWDFWRRRIFITLIELLS